MEYSIRPRAAVLFVAMFSVACDYEEPQEFGDGELEYRSDGGGRESPPPPPGREDGGGDGGDWISNGLSDWDVSGLDPAFPLDSPLGLQDDDDDLDDLLVGGKEGWLADGNADEFGIIQYVIECALPEGQSIVKQVDKALIMLPGALGLAPEWKTGPCDESCQQWISACLMARRNSSGQVVNIWLQGAHPSLGFGSHASFPNFEGVYFGNLFDGTDKQNKNEFACRGDHHESGKLHGRDCTSGDSTCDLVIFEDCVQDAGCDLSATGVPAIDCQPDPNGPIYNAISVHLQ